MTSLRTGTVFSKRCYHINLGLNPDLPVQLSVLERSECTLIVSKSAEHGRRSMTFSVIPAKNHDPVITTRYESRIVQLSYKASEDILLNESGSTVQNE